MTLSVVPQFFLGKGVSLGKPPEHNICLVIDVIVLDHSGALG